MFRIGACFASICKSISIFFISHICYAFWILLWNICNMLLVPFIISELNTIFGIFILYLYESHNYILLWKIILQTLWKFHVVSSGFPDSWGVCVAGDCCISWKTSSQAFLSLAPRDKFPEATELSLYCSSVSLHIFLFAIFVLF